MHKTKWFWLAFIIFYESLENAKIKFTQIYFLSTMVWACIFNYHWKKYQLTCSKIIVSLQSIFSNASGKYIMLKILLILIRFFCSMHFYAFHLEINLEKMLIQTHPTNITSVQCVFAGNLLNLNSENAHQHNIHMI